MKIAISKWIIVFLTRVTGDINYMARISSEYMLLCGSCNRAKSWSCEHCANWLEEESPRCVSPVIGRTPSDTNILLFG